MSLLCWNARGLGNPGALTALQTIVRKFSPSLVFLSETKLYGGWAEGIQRHVNFQNSFHVDCVGKSGGLLLLWNEDWEVSVKSFSVGHIDALVQCPGRRQGAAHVQERLDRFCCNQDWHNLFPSVRVINGDLLHSDHRPEGERNSETVG
ncbi:hypothetical protein G4B88_005973 [Cannabis sativa]|uniref:Endonuclease/exonuclease/phosphatase domain-containing protein n=1 Tax=Cannabis sativa TaxID=3483 RepID=A0A7J6IAN7_CANSA|nr:hypothetical protein G4B88_005973 [Cannabis sativa]